MSSHRREEVSERLSRIEGHLHAVHRMVEEDRTYAEVARQIGAVRAGLDAVLQVIVDDLVEDCVAPPAKKGAHVVAARELRHVVATVL